MPVSFESRRGFLRFSAVATALPFLYACGVPSPQQRGPTAEQEIDCSKENVPIIFVDEQNNPIEGDPAIVSDITVYNERIPAAMVARVRSMDFSIIIVPGPEAVQARYPGQGNAGAFTDYTNREIVLDNQLNYPHELSHAIDFAFGFVSLQPDFMRAGRAYSQRHLVRLRELRGNYSGVEGTGTTDLLQQDFLQSLDRQIALHEQFISLEQLPIEDQQQQILSNSDLFLTVSHIFVGGFQTFYYPELFAFEEDETPEVMAYIQRFDQEQNSIC